MGEGVWHLSDDAGRSLLGGEGSRVLVMGCAGMLGRAVTATLSAHGIDWVGTGRGTMDLGDARALRREAEHWLPQDGVVVNCGAWTDVDGAEQNEAGALAVNGDGPGVLAGLCRDRGALLVHFSTDYVFDGVGTRGYTTDHAIAPVNAYGRSKAAGERAIAASGCEHLIVRTSWLHAAWGKNFVRTIAGLCLSKPQIKVVDDQVGRPTCCWHLASATLGLLRHGARGMWHVTDGGPETSWCGFAREIARHVERRWGKACEVAACSTAEFPRPARRPAYSVLELSGTEGAIGMRPDWRVGLGEVMATMPRPG